MNSDSASFPFHDLESALKSLAVVCLDLLAVPFVIAELDFAAVKLSKPVEG
jgi:hypothetical protein